MKTAFNPFPKHIPAVPMKVWLADQAARMGITIRALLGRIYRGKHPKPLCIFQSKNVRNVVLWHPQSAVFEIQSGTIRLFDWIKQESDRTGLNKNTIRSKLRRGKYHDLKITRFNQSKVVVSVAKNSCFSAEASAS